MEISFAAQLRPHRRYFKATEVEGERVKTGVLPLLPLRRIWTPFPDARIGHKRDDRL
jgi:hypothetical protein